MKIKNRIPIRKSPNDIDQKDLIKSIQKQNGYSKNQSIEIVDSVLEHIKSSLENGDDVLISGFGKFQTRKGQSQLNWLSLSGE